MASTLAVWVARSAPARRGRRAIAAVGGGVLAAGGVGGEGAAALAAGGVGDVGAAALAVGVAGGSPTGATAGAAGAGSWADAATGIRRRAPVRARLRSGMRTTLDLFLLLPVSTRWTPNSRAAFPERP